MTTTTAIQSTITPFRHPQQTFVWFGQEWDIAKLIADIDTGKLLPMKDTLERAFIEAYATQTLALDRKKGPDVKTVSLMMHVDVKAAMALPQEALQEPVILLFAGKKKGMLCLDTSGTANHVLADGQHRIAKAFFEDVPTLPTYVLSAAQSRKYRMT